MAKRDFDPLCPGEILLEEFLHPMGISQYRLAKDISVPQRRISEITQGKRSIAADTALRLGRYFGMEAQFWLNLHSRYDLLRAETELDDRLERLRAAGRAPGSSLCGHSRSRRTAICGFATTYRPRHGPAPCVGT